MIAVARHFTVSPAEILGAWSMPLFMDSLESMQVEAEIQHRINEVQQ